MRKELVYLSKKKGGNFAFRFVKFFIRLFYPKTELIGQDQLSNEPMVIVGNHTQMHGPIACELYFPDNSYTWCAGQMMHLKEVPAYAFRDFWSYKPKAVRWFYKLLSYIIAPISVLIFNNARTIPVYHDARIVSTIRESMKKLDGGNHVIIFPEHDVEYNNIIYDFQDRFIDLARFYYKKTGKELSFAPLYIAPSLKKMYLGQPIKFDFSNNIDAERDRIKNYLMKEITDIATALPEHTVVPYRNLPKRLYQKNTAADIQEDNDNEKAGS